MLGALGKAFGATGKAIGKGAKNMGSRMKSNMQNAPQAGGIGTDPSPSFMSRFGQAMPGISQSISTMGQPQNERFQQPPQQQQDPMGMSGMMGGLSPLIQRLLQQYKQPQGQQPPPQQMGVLPGISGNAGMGMDVGPSVPFEQMVGRGRMHGMYS